MLAKHLPQHLNVMLVQNDVNSTLLENALNIDGYNLLKAQNGAMFVALAKETRPDVILINLDNPTDQLFSDLQTLHQQFPCPVVLFVNGAAPETIQKAVQVEVGALVVNGVDGQCVGSMIELARARFRHLQDLKNALEEAKTQLEDRKQIDRAKAILIKTQNFSEDQAYHTLRKLAMDRNITLGEMARNVIAMAELLK